ncbi:YitT family protein [Clostridium swellfunianum]|uniref:YitT family protein n=1 Tax=Clostridium swellfunianum TaxID=1367462 RepID=UPI002030ADE6|nr:YitT family protein [Clostridium swellfunianum]MCM0650015.1 YitT family protein [Clostridium swellfunianum]
MMVEAKKIIKRAAVVSLGSLIYALAINIFIAPHKLLSGGIAGLSLLAQYATQIPSGYWVFILNIPIFIVGLKKIDKDFVIFSMIGMFSMSCFLVLTRDLSRFITVKDLFISTLFGAVLSGVGMGLIFKNRASQGGTDIIAVIIKNKKAVKMSTLYFVLNSAIVLFGVFVTSIELTLYTILSMFIKSLVIDRIMEGFDQKKIVMIITQKEKEISGMIMEETGRGTTYLYGEGAYTGEQKKVIYSLMTNKELNVIRKLIENIDPMSIISVSEAEEIRGSGFLKPVL